MNPAASPLSDAERAAAAAAESAAAYQKYVAGPAAEQAVQDRAAAAAAESAAAYQKYVTEPAAAKARADAAAAAAAESAAAYQKYVTEPAAAAASGGAAAGSVTAPSESDAPPIAAARPDIIRGNGSVPRRPVAPVGASPAPQSTATRLRELLRRLLGGR